ncbi:MAG: sensor histidine kinase [Candidatus Niyogibacteria bacterium]|nr:sensor histidine kinase [Candidatus Niyogibacteria bacterium]
MSGAMSRVRLKSLTIFLVVLTPVLILGIVNYFQVREDLTDAAMSRRASIAFLTATLLHERLDRLVDVGTALTTRVRFRELVEAGDWPGAAETLRDAPVNFPYIERIILVDTAGTVHGDTEMSSDIIGKNFAFRDWYKGVSAQWEPYVSELFEAAAAPFYTGVAVVIPVKSENGTVLGIVAMQVVTGTLLDWAKDIEVGSEGFVYFTDQRGRLLAHPKFPTQTEIVDFSSMSAVERLLRGETGTGIFYNSLENTNSVVAYTPVSEYRWGVVVSQPERAAFAERDRSLFFITAIYAVIAFLAFLLAYFMLRLRRNEEENLEFREGTLLQIVHDLRAPSNVIRLIVSRYTPEFLEKYPELKQDALRIGQANARMLNLIQYLFEIVKGEREGLEFRRDPVDLPAAVESALREMEPAIRERGIAIEHKKPVKTPPIIGDWERLKEVFVNLIDNAVKYNRESGSITISYEMNGAGIATRIRDTGMGIARENLPKMFLPYFREKPDGAPGTGLGLFIVKNFVEKMGGSISIDSKIGEGTTFIVRFPVASP